MDTPKRGAIYPAFYQRDPYISPDDEGLRKPKPRVCDECGYLGCRPECPAWRDPEDNDE